MSPWMVVHCAARPRFPAEKGIRQFSRSPQCSSALTGSLYFRASQRFASLAVPHSMWNRRSRSTRHGVLIPSGIYGMIVLRSLLPRGQVLQMTTLRRVQSCNRCRLLRLSLPLAHSQHRPSCWHRLSFSSQEIDGIKSYDRVSSALPAAAHGDHFQFVQRVAPPPPKRLGTGTAWRSIHTIAQRR